MREKIKHVFKTKTSRYGSYSVGMTALVICIAVVVNLIVGQLPENIRNIDISDNRIYEISDTSKEILKKLDKEVTFQVFAEKGSTDERIKTFLEKYTALSGRITVEWIDPVLHPSELTDHNVDSDTVLVSCEDTGRSKAVAFRDIIVVDEYSYYTTGSATESEFDGEGRFTSAINYVTSDVTKKIYNTSGHGESTFSASVSELLEKNNMEEEELNLLMAAEIPDDCDLLFMYAPSKDITEEEKSLLADYMSGGGRIFVILGDGENDTPNLDAFLEEYGIGPESGYIADMQRNYQGNYYYIFPQIGGGQELTEGLTSDMVLLINAHGLQVTDPARDSINVTSFMSTSSDSYAVTQEDQKQGTYTLGAVATEKITDGDSDEEAGNGAETDDDAEEDGDTRPDTESRLTVISAASLIDSQVTDAFPTLENLDLFMNAISANFDDVENAAIESKSLAVTYNTMRHAGGISLLVIFGIPSVILIYGFIRWWKRRKA